MNCVRCGSKLAVACAACGEGRCNACLRPTLAPAVHVCGPGGCSYGARLQAAQVAALVLRALCAANRLSPEAVLDSLDGPARPCETDQLF